MNLTNEAIDDVFDFETFDENGLDISLTADQHLFDNGPDLFGQIPLAGEFAALPVLDNLVYPLTGGFSDQSLNLSDHDYNFFNNNPDLFTDGSFDAVTMSFTTYNQSEPQLMSQQPGGGPGYAFGADLPGFHKLPVSTADHGITYSQHQPAPQTVLATIEEQQQWQSFRNQQASAFQEQLQVPQSQQIPAVQPWQNFVEPSLNPWSPSDLPIDDQVSLDVQDLSGSETPDSSQQDILSGEQIRLLQDSQSVEDTQPSVMSLQSDAVILHDETSSRSVRPRHPDPSSRAATPEQAVQHVQPPHNQIAGLTFASLEDAEAAMPSRYIENAWEPLSQDNTVPTTQEQRAKYVLEMFRAFQDCSTCKDNKQGHSFIKRWSNGPDNYYNLHAMEKVCWQMLDIAERMHAEGPQSTAIYCEEALRKLKGSRNMTFAQRIHHICAILEYSKFLCDQLMKGEGLEALVGTPKQKLAGATTMKTQNQKRQKWIVHGRTEDSLHPTTEDGNGVEEEEDSEGFQPTRRKTKPKTKRTRTKPRLSLIHI